MPQIVTPSVALLEETCTELWYDPDELARDKGIEAQAAALAVLEATNAIRMLTGYRFSGQQCWLEDYTVGTGQTRLKVKRDVEELYYAQVITATCAEDLPEELEEDLDGACLIGDSLVKFNNTLSSRLFDPMYSSDAPCAPQGGVLRVMYRTPNNVPAGADRVVARLAHEYVLACTGDGRCRLPERLTSVTRQGVSWSVLGPDEFLDRGLTGIGAIDHWLNVVNQPTRGLYGINPLETGVRRRAVLLGCGPGCEAASGWPDVEEES
jgi:hypothetical protein